MSSAGECLQCGTMTVLNEGGLCTKCKDLPPCIVHAEYLSSGRCLGCREYHCSLCMKGGRCEPCRAKSSAKGKDTEKGGPKTPRERLTAYLESARKKPVKAAAPVLGLLIAIKGLLVGMEYFGEQKTVLTPDELYLYRLSAVQQAVDAFHTEQGRLPQRGHDLYTQLGKTEYWLPLIQTKDVVLIPHAVIYLVKDGKYELRATDAQGELFAMNGKVVVMTQE